MVGTGSVCRSPAADHLLRAHLEGRGAGQWFAVTSAGTHPLVGSGVDIETARALAAEGVDAGDHLARRLTERRVAQADLVLTAEGSHRLAVAALRPDAAPRTFTLREFERLAIAAIEAGARGPQGLVEAASALRDNLPPSEPADDDVEDPVGGPYAAYEAAIGMINSATYTVAAALARDLDIDLWAGSPLGEQVGRL
jgi:protein-tyrosine phosphatase